MVATQNSTPRRSHEARLSLDSTQSDGHRSRTNSIKAPALPPNSASTSPLARAGVKGDRLMIFVTVFASLGVFLFGYDQGVMSGIITGPYFKAYFNNPSPYEIGAMVSILEIGALVTSLACGTLADTFGRKRILFCGACVFVVGGSIQTLSSGFQSMVLGRILAGFGVGALTMVVPTYQSEISPAEDRGRLACIEFTINIVGYASSVWIDYFCSFIASDQSWRLPLSVQVIVGIVLALGSLLLPESPRWLLDTDQDEEGMRVLADLHGGGDPTQPRARLEYREIKESVLFMRSQGDRSYRAMFRRCWYRVMIACSSQMFAQLNGINVVSYYAPLIFESAGWIGRDAILMAGINGIIYVLATIPSWFLIDVLGRRKILMFGSVVTCAALAACGYFLYIDTKITPQAVVACIIIFNAGFAGTWGSVPWLLPPEIMPLVFRAKGTSLSTATNWVFNWLVGEVTPILQELIKWRLYIMHSFFCFLSLLMVFFLYPETMGVPLEEMDELFGDAPGPIPQHDDEEDEERVPLQRDSSDGMVETGEVRAIRRSISSHPRFMSAEERIAREAAIKVAQEERRRRTTAWFGLSSNGRPRPSLRNLFQGWGQPTRAEDTTEYTAVNPNEH